MHLNKLHTKHTKPAAVIVLVEEATDTLLLTKRNRSLSHHPGEVCFPGGMWQLEDNHLVDTALRELDEELGISPDRVTLLHSMRKQQTLSGTIIQPWFGHIASIMPYLVNEEEVESIVKVPMELVYDKNNYQPIKVKRNNKNYTTYLFTASDNHIWGATVHIMRQLIRY